MVDALNVSPLPFPGVGAGGSALRHGYRRPYPPKQATKQANRRTFMFTRNGRHVAAEGRSGWRRKVAGVPVVGWFVFGSAGAALAAWFILLGLSGTVSTAAVDVNYEVGIDPIETGNCTASYVGSKDLAIAWSNAVGGEQCTIEVVVRADSGNTTPATLQAFDLAGNPGLLTSTSSCGLQIPAGSTDSVVFTIEVDEATTSPGDTFTLDPSSEGLSWVPLSLYDAGACA